MHTRNRRGGKSLSSDVHAVCSLICFRSSVKWHFLNIPLQVITSPPRRPPSLSLVSLSSQHLPVWHYVFHFFLKLITCLQNYKGSSGRAQMGVCCFPALNAESWPHLRDSTGQLPDLWGNRLTAMTSFFFFFFFGLFGCTGSQSPQNVGSLVAAYELLVAASGIQFPDHGWNPGLLHWECGALTTGPQGSLMVTISEWRNNRSFYSLLSATWHLNFCNELILI